MHSMMKVFSTARFLVNQHCAFNRPIANSAACELATVSCREYATNHTRLVDSKVVVRKESLDVSVHKAYKEILRDAKSRRSSVHSEWNMIQPPNTTILYTDGAYYEKPAMSGIGIFISPKHPLNASFKVISPEHNSNLAEIAAATTALKNLRQWDSYNNEHVIVRSDVLGLITGLQAVSENKHKSFRSCIDTESYSKSAECSQMEFRFNMSKDTIWTGIRPIMLKESLDLAVSDEYGEILSDVKLRRRRVQSEWNMHYPPNTILAFTDGAFYDKSPSLSGIGIFVGPSHPLNSSFKILGPVHNSSLAEIAAATTALQSIKSWEDYNNEHIIVRSDFLGLITGLRAIADSKPKNFRFSEIYSELLELCQDFPNGVLLQHIYGHDVDGDASNDAADYLSKHGALIGRDLESTINIVGRKKDRSKDGAFYERYPPLSGIGIFLEPGHSLNGRKDIFEVL